MQPLGGPLVGDVRTVVSNVTTVNRIARTVVSSVDTVDRIGRAVVSGADAANRIGRVVVSSAGAGDRNARALVCSVFLQRKNRLQLAEQGPMHFALKSLGADVFLRMSQFAYSL